MLQFQPQEDRVDLDALARSVRDLRLFRADVKTGIFAEQLVRATLSELFRFEYEETKWINGRLIDINTSVNEGAKEFGYQEIGHTGRAKMVADNATDIPKADLQGRYNIRPVKTVATSIDYSTQDVRSARMQGMFDIATEKAQAAREAMDFELNDLIRVGDSAAGFRGITNAPGIIVQSAATGSWASAAAADIISDFTAAANTIINNSGGVEVPNAVAMPVAIFTRLSTLPFDSSSGPMSVLEYLQKAFPMINIWEWDPGMSAVSATGGSSVLIYRKDARRARVVMPMVMRALPPESKGLTFEIVFETRFGGVIVPKPRSVLRLDGV